MDLRRWAIRTGIALGLAAGLVTIVQSQPQSASEPLGPAWSKSLAGVVALGVSPEGERVLAADDRGVVHSIDERGAPVWDQPIPDVDSVVTSRGGELSLAYAARRPLSRRVFFLDDAGRRRF